MRIAVIGLGSMGLPIAERLAEADGIELVVFDADPATLEAAATLGMPAPSVPAAVGGVDAIFTILPADQQVEAVSDSLLAAAEAGQVYADFSTIAPATIERIAERLAPAGVRTLSVAITRGTAAARLGELGLFVGGDEIVVARLRPALQAIASEIRTTGDLGSAKALKIANNMVVGCLNVGICEALVLGRKLGIAPDAITTHLAESGADGWVLRNHIVAHVLTNELGPGQFSTFNMAKDMRLFVDMAANRGTPATLAGTASACYRGAIAAGYGEDYHPVVVRWLERMSDGPDPVQQPLSELKDVMLSISGGVAALQALANFQALQVLRAAGMTTLEAAEHLQSGSAGNESLLSVGRNMTINRRALLAQLERLLDLANRTSTPAFMFETARHTALSPR
jgi:3-hydroxyisobutyrate dehydrogenase